MNLEHLFRVYVNDTFRNIPKIHREKIVKNLLKLTKKWLQFRCDNLHDVEDQRIITELLEDLTFPAKERGKPK